MTASPVTNSNNSAGTSSNPSQAAQSAKMLAANMDTFLKLLTTQLKNQDPMAPMDSTQFTNQLVQFSGVEQSIQQNKNLEAISSKLDALTKPTLSQALDYMNKDVLVDSDKAFFNGSKGVEWRYTLPKNADQCEIDILDSNDQVVQKLVGSKKMGEHAVNWDGTNWLNQKAPNGDYKLVVKAIGPDDKGKPSLLNVPVTYKAHIDGVTQDNGIISLAAGGDRIAMDKIVQVANAAATAS